MRYRDQDYFLLGAAIESFLKTTRGPQADLWHMVQTEVLEPIGIHHASAVRTQQSGAREGLVMISIVMGKAAAEKLEGEATRSNEDTATIRAVERLAPF
jgi:hypothetical protein